MSTRSDFRSFHTDIENGRVDKGQFDSQELPSQTPETMASNQMINVVLGVQMHSHFLVMKSSHGTDTKDSAWKQNQIRIQKSEKRLHVSVTSLVAKYR